MQTDKHMSETVWTWTINELYRKVVLVEVLGISGLYQPLKIGPSLVTATQV